MSKQRYPLTHPQKRVWETEKFVQHSPISNLIGTIKIKGLLDFNKFEQAINLFILKNDAIRIRLVENDDGVKQYISPYHEKKFELLICNKIIKRLMNGLLKKLVNRLIYWVLIYLNL